MRTIIFLALSLLLSGACLAEEQEPPANSGEALYAYDENNPPEVFFFPPEKAKWDGYKVTMKEWYLLTKLQKEKFISEYFGELKNQYSASIEAAGLDDYLKALNLFSYYSNEKAVNEPSTKFVNDLLVAQGQIAPGGQNLKKESVNV